MMIDIEILKRFRDDRIASGNADFDEMERLNAFIANVETSDRRGEWIKYDDDMIGCYNCRCSACKTQFFIPPKKGKIPYNFCPECGADMRREP